MTQPMFTTEEILVRLESLYDKLDNEGWHVRANTVALAMDEIKRLKAFEENAD